MSIQIASNTTPWRKFCALALCLLCFVVGAAEPPSAPMLRIDPGVHTAAIGSIATDDAGRYLVTASNDKTARVWDLSDGRLLSTLRIPSGNGGEGTLYAGALSPDGQVVALGGWTQFNNGSSNPSSSNDGHIIYLFDRASGRVLRTINGLRSGVYQLAFSPDGRTLAASLGGKLGLRIFSVADGRLIGEDTDYGDSAWSLHFSTNEPGSLVNRLITCSDDGLLRLYRFDGASLTLLRKNQAPGGRQPGYARFSPDGNAIAVAFHDSPLVNVLDGHDLSFRFAPSTTGVNKNLAYGIAWSRDGETLYATGWASHDTVISGIEHHSFYIRQWAQRGHGALIDRPISNDVLRGLVSLPNGRLAFFGAGPIWGVVGSEGAPELLHTSAGADFRNSQAMRGNDVVNRFLISGDGARVQFTYKPLDEFPAVFDSLSHAFVTRIPTGLFPPTTSLPSMSVSDWESNVAPKLNGVALQIAKSDLSNTFALIPTGERLILGTRFALYAFDRGGNKAWKQSAPDVVWGVNVSKDGRWVVAAYADGTIRWHRASDGFEQLALFLHTDRKRWVMWSPSGYYDASPGADELIGWHLNHGKDQAADFFPASRFRSQFYRPDVLTKLLDTRDEAEAVRLANAESGRKTQVNSIVQVLPPVVEIVSPNEGTRISQPNITVQYKTRTPGDAPVTAMRVRVNGQAVPEVRGLTRTDAGGVSATRELTFPMPAKDSEIQLFAENKNGVSTPAVLRVTWAGAKPAAQETEQYKPKLYVLAVGVSKYANPEFNLGLAAKDATDLAAVFQKQKGRLFADVQIKLLTDGKATKDDVLDGLDWLKREVTSRDVGVMFLAGHGMNDNTGKYFFMPYNADPAKLLRTGVPQNDIKDTLNSLAGKAVFFVDTCHAGNALGTSTTRGIGSVTDAFVNELAAAENGVVVFAASTGRQLSQENPAWGNGAFTKAVVEGLNGKADFQKSGKITHKGLDYYVSERVKELTKGTQSPVSIAPQGVTDFPIALVR